MYFFCVYLPAASLPIELFKEYVDMIHELYSVYSQNGTVIFAGDFNANVQGPRVNFPKGERCKYLQNVLDDLNLISLNTQDCCTGPKHTFQGYENGPCTTIDHIVIPIDIPFVPKDVKFLIVMI